MTIAIADTYSTLADYFIAEGESEEASGNRPFLIDDSDAVWFVEEGKLELFTVSVKAGLPVGARTHFVSVEKGQYMFGMDLNRYGMGSGFLAVGRVGSKLRRLTVPRLQKLAAMGRFIPDISTAVDTWISNLSRSLTRDIIPGPLVDTNLGEEQVVALANQQKARSNKGVLWLEVEDGDLLFIGMEALSLAGEEMYFPVTPDTWIEASNDAGHSTKFTAHPTRAVAGESSPWWGLDTFHEALCHCEFINKKLAVVDEFNRLKSKAEYSNAAEAAAYRSLATVLSSKDQEDSFGSTAADESDAVFEACRLIGQKLGMKVKRHPNPRPQANWDERLAEVAKASRFRTRQVALRDDWWNRDHGPFITQHPETKDVWALIPTSPRAYQAINPRTGQRVKANADLAEMLSPFGFTFYRPFPDGPLAVFDLLKFGSRGMITDFITLMILGVSTGMLGTLTPYATGQIFDQALPQAEKGLLVQFVVALFVAAVTASAFKIAQAVAVLRIQGRMDYSVQSALWDRLLNLPATFFRDYNAGDLADRAAGINKIRDLLSQAGVSAILGALSSVFYLAMLFTYSVAMAMVAIGLTIFFVGFTTLANVLQLRFQRTLATSNGRITGMVLQLIGGVGKLRISGAENHAFRVWAQEFAAMRRTSFHAERVQNAVQVFNSGFPILSSMAIFLGLIMVQSKAAPGLPPAMTTGGFIAFTSAFGMFAAAMQTLSGASLNLLGVMPIYERLKPIITTTPESDENKAYPGKLTGEIEISHVHFRYQEDGPWILKDISLKIAPGEFIAFVGGSGSGKSTLFRLMLGFEIPEKGSVYFDGQDLRTLDLREVRQQMGVVLQTSRLLPTDIFRNIVGTTSLTIADAWEAARMAGFDKDIEQMAMGMHTYISEGGGGFSGGQKQRLLIARSIVHRPRMIFLDEATSALDNRTQAIVTQSMAKMQATRVAIAHRLSTVVDADRICVLEMGQIREIGSYEELMKLNGRFAELARRQIA